MLTYGHGPFTFGPCGRDFHVSRRANPRQKRAEEAADQMWKKLLLGYSFEVGAALSTDDSTTQALLILRKNHPEVIVTMLQSRGIVLTLGKPGTVSKEAWGQLDKGGYFPDAKVAPEIFFAQHAQFMRRNDVDPEDAIRKAQEADRSLNTVEISK
jgi:hypothetical protein